MSRLPGSTPEQRKAVIDRLRQPPAHYPVCHRTECPLSVQCLRHRQWLLHRHDPYLMQVNPDEPSLMTDSCRHFRQDTICTYALGLLSQYGRMNKEQRRVFRFLCFRKIARTNFFYQLNGTRQTTPEEQSFIRLCAHEVGCDFSPEGFDHTFTAPAW